MYSKPSGQWTGQVVPAPELRDGNVQRNPQVGKTSLESQTRNLAGGRASHEFIRFFVGGTDYGIDLSADHTAELRGTLRRYAATG